MSKIVLKCELCKTEFERERGEHNRNTKKGRRVFCSLSCSGKQHFIDYPSKGNPEYLVGHYDNRKDEYTHFKWFLKCAKNRRANRKVSITLEYLKKLWQDQKGICLYTGWELVLPDNYSGWKNRDNRSRRASLDRIDCSKGYIEGNVQYVSFMANIAKGDMTDDEMFKFCKAVAENNIIKSEESI